MSNDNAIAAVEIVYEQEALDALWLKRVVEAFAPMLERGLGVFGWCYNAASLSQLKLFHPTVLGTPPGALEAVFRTASHPARRPEMLVEHYATPAGAISEQLREHYDGYEPLHETLVPMGIRDIITVNAFDVDGSGVAINAFSPEKATISPAYRRQLEQLAAHLISAYRLRRQSSVTEAVLDEGGRVLHASASATSPESTENLTLAARAVAKARGSLRRTQPTEALQIWRALVDGRWSLVDVVDTDGKRFLVARVNEPMAAGPASLSMREKQVACLVGRGHSNKLIAYDLGIGEGTVGSYLKSAMLKMGLESRSQLIRLFAAHEDSDDPSAQDQP